MININSLSNSMTNLSLNYRGISSDLVLVAFEYLEGKDLRNCTLVHSEWNRYLKSDYAMKTLWHRVATKEFAFGPDQYLHFFKKKCINVPRLPDDIVKILNEDCPIFGGKVYQHWMLTYIPACFNDDQTDLLTLNALEKLVQAPLDVSGGHKTNYCYFYDVQTRFGDQALGKSLWVLMSKTVVPGTRDKSFQLQQSVVQELREKHKIIYSVPETVLEVAASVSTHYTRTGERCLSSDDPYTYSRVKQTLNGGWAAVVGGFSQKDGLNFLCFHFDFDNVGVAVCRKILGR